MMIDIKKEAFAVFCGDQPIMAFLFAFSLAVASQTIFFELLSGTFDSPKYFVALFVGAGGVAGGRKRYKRLTSEKPE